MSSVKREVSDEDSSVKCKM